MQREVVRGRRAGRQRDDGAQRAPAQQVGPDPAPGAAGGGGGRHQHHGGAAVTQPGERVLHPGQLGLGAGGKAVLPARVVGEFVVAPVALVERRVAQHRVGPHLRAGVGPQGVAGHGAHAGAGVQGEAERGEGGEFGGAVLGVQLLAGAVGDGAEQGAGAAGRVEDGAGGAGEAGHEGGEFGGGGRVLARVAVEVAAEQELEGVPGTARGGEFGDAAQEGGGGEQLRAGGEHKGGGRGGGGRGAWAGVHSVRGVHT